MPLSAKPSKQPVQEAEGRLLCQAVQEATRWLSEGNFSAGYRCLLDGLERAKEWDNSGEAWAEELVDSWRAALFEYADLYPRSEKIVMTPRPPIPPECLDVFVRRG
jgi:hypothetical protein